MSVAAALGVVLVMGFVLVGWPSPRVATTAAGPQASAVPASHVTLSSNEPAAAVVVLPEPAPLIATPIVAPVGMLASDRTPTFATRINATPRPAILKGVAESKNVTNSPAVKSVKSVKPATSKTPAPERQASTPEPAVRVAVAANELPQPSAKVAPSETSASVVPPVQPLVTISGCLEINIGQDKFRLTDTDGDELPKARSWRSGFLKKRSAPVELVDLRDPVGMQKYVGLRVTATGVLTDRELKVESLRAGASCR